MATQIDGAAVQRQVMAALNERRFNDALVAVASLVAAAPRSGWARHYAALALAGLDEIAAAEREIRLAVEYEPKEAAHQAGLADILVKLSRFSEAEAAYRAALARDPRHPAAVAFAYLMIAQGRPAEAAPFIEPLGRSPAAGLYVLAGAAATLNAVGRKPEALEMYRRAVRMDPNNPLLEHNLAAVLEEMQLYAEAEQAARRAILKGSTTSSGVLGRALQGLDRFDEAQEAFQLAIRERPTDVGVHRDFAALTWQRTASREAMTEALDWAIASYPEAETLGVTRASMLTESGDPKAAYDSLQHKLAGAPGAAVHAAAAQAALAWDSELSLEHARRSFALNPDSINFGLVLAESLLAEGEAEEADLLVTLLLSKEPDNQYLIALQALAWRLRGDDRYRQLYDYDQLVQVFDIEAPSGWASLDAYIADLAQALERMNNLPVPPLDQSVRNGAQTQRDLTLEEDPAIRAFFAAVQKPIAAYRASLGPGTDPLRRRNPDGDVRFSGAWSVKLTPSGYHANHIHRQGWISSAFYVQTPKAVEGDDRQGWIKFGQPERPTKPALGPEHFVQPRPGRLVLFPSYMWHGTVPFEGDEHRLTMAFDIIPKPRGR